MTAPWRFQPGAGAKFGALFGRLDVDSSEGRAALARKATASAKVKIKGKDHVPKQMHYDGLSLLWWRYVWARDARAEGDGVGEILYLQ